MLAPVVTSVSPTSNGTRSASSSRWAMPHAVVVVLDVLEQDAELVAAEPGRRVAVAQAAAQPGRHLPEQRVAGGVPEAVVDGLEVVEVDEQDAVATRRRGTGPSRGRGGRGTVPGWPAR